MRELDADLGGPVHYADFGGAGSPLVFVHGLSGSPLNWLAVAPRLAETHRVFAIDLIGHGKTPLAGRPATLANHRRLLDAVIERVAAAPAVLVGPSTGGGAASTRWCAGCRRRPWSCRAPRTAWFRCGPCRSSSRCARTGSSTSSRSWGTCR